ncbi:MAG: outer membrane lipid asymmetry maintenance protein MlaD [Holosporales bacterium]|jgi:phospholipid/cholesterol/gamma-HCH transport system substrate-binding protein|nr:outer membrane lipid asymmetry maintenance protein MlaD [Holosporales bacterium]
MKGNVLEAIIGGVVLIVASFFMYFAYTSSGEKVKQGYVLLTRFEDVSGIMVGSDVKLNGIKIGMVKSLLLDENYQANVNILIKEEVKIPVDSAAHVSTEGLMGNKFISIVPGFKEEKLKEGDEIEVTRSAVNLERLIDKFLIGMGKK